MTSTATQIGGLLALTLTLMGCSSDKDVAKKSVDRKDTADSTFTPVELESTIDSLASAIRDTEEQDLKIDILLKNLAGAYWGSVATGANRAIGELNVRGSLSAPRSNEEPSVELQQQRVRELREAGTDGLGIAPYFVDLGDEIDATVEAGIPVVVMDGDLPDTKRDLFVGTLNAGTGPVAADTLLSYLPPAPGSVVILGFEDEAWPDGYARSVNARTAIEAKGYNVVTHKIDWTSTGEAADVEALKTLLTETEPKVVGMMGLFSVAFRCAMAAEAVGKTGDDIAIVAFDFEPQTVSYMRSGLIKATHAVRQYYMGYVTPYILYGMNVLGKKETIKLLSKQLVDGDKFSLGMDIVKGDQIDEYYDFLDDLGVGGE